MGNIAAKLQFLIYPVFPFYRDLAVIVASMAYNTWFTKLYCKDLRIVSINLCATPYSIPEGSPTKVLNMSFMHQGSEVTEQVLHTVSKSSSLEEITLENAGLKS